METIWWSFKYYYHRHNSSVLTFALPGTIFDSFSVCLQNIFAKFSVIGNGS